MAWTMKRSRRPTTSLSRSPEDGMLSCPFDLGTAPSRASLPSTLFLTRLNHHHPSSPTHLKSNPPEPPPGFS